MGWKTVTITALGANGAAEGEAEIQLTEGGTSILHAVYINYGDMPSTTDVIVSEILPNGDEEALLTVSDSNTDGRRVPKVPTVDASGAAIDDQYEYYVVGNRLKVSVEDANAGTMTVSVMVV